MRKTAFLPILILLVVFSAGCASILVKETRSFKTTTLFARDCSVEAERIQFSKKFMEVKREKYLQDVKDGKCHVPDTEQMVKNFLSIPETNGDILGDTIELVRSKGFKIYWDEQKGDRVPNTRALFGDEALMAIGMGVGGDARFAQDAKAISDFKGRHYGEIYEQEDIFHVIDRICINTRNAVEKGDVYTFVIVWRDGHVLRRVIKGGSIDHPSSEHAFLLCPGDAIAGGISKGAEIGLKSVIP